MDFESPDVEKDFPGLYASESGRKSNESDFSEGGDHDKPSKKDLLGRRKDKKEKKDRGYAALEGESSPEEDTDTKSPSKSKKTKSFKFPTKSKEKREKSRDKEKVLEDAVKQKELSEKEKRKEKEKEKEKKEKEKKIKEKDKEKEEKAKFKLESKEKLKDEKKEKSKDKDKIKDKEKVKDKDKEKVKEKDKEKVKDKDKKDKKLAKVPSTVTSGIPFEEIFTLGVALPIFGVPLQQSVERSRCHDDTRLPLVVRDAIDYLQEHGLKSSQIYRPEVDKVKLQQLRKLYTDRGSIFPYHWDVPVASAILKGYLSELPESILTQELHTQFEQSTAMAEPQRELQIHSLITKLPEYNRNLLGWLVRHFETVVANEQHNHMSLPSLSSAMCPALNMSQNLFTYLVSKASKFFPDVELTKYIPPLVCLPAQFPEEADELRRELSKQESLLAQVHAEMHAGFTTPAGDHQLWEAQRIVTQIKRKLRSVQKSVEPQSLPPQPSVEDRPEDEQQQTQTQQQPRPETETVTAITHAEPEIKPPIEAKPTVESPKPKEAVFPTEFDDDFDFQPTTTEITTTEITTTENKTTKIPTTVTELQSPVKDKPKLTENELKKLRLELENAEYQQLKSLLQAKINSEQFEIVKLRSQIALKSKQNNNSCNKENKDVFTPEDEDLKQKLMKENALLEQKRMNIINQIFEERVACIQLKIELAMKDLI